MSSLDKLLNRINNTARAQVPWEAITDEQQQVLQRALKLVQMGVDRYVFVSSFFSILLLCVQRLFSPRLLSPPPLVLASLVFLAIPSSLTFD